MGSTTFYDAILSTMLTAQSGSEDSERGSSESSKDSESRTAGLVLAIIFGVLFGLLLLSAICGRCTKNTTLERRIEHHDQDLERQDIEMGPSQRPKVFGSYWTTVQGSRNWRPIFVVKPDGTVIPTRGDAFRE